MSGEQPKYLMSYKCQNIGNIKGAISEKQLAACRTKLLQDPRICVTSGSENYPSYYPHPDCRDQSEALLNASLKSDYQDCPGNVDNIAITNVHRLMNHFAPRDIISTPETCANEAGFSFAKLNFDF